MCNNWTGNPGSKPTKNYVSVKAAVCPNAPWAGQDVCDYPTTENYQKSNVECFWTMPDGRIGHTVTRVVNAREHFHGDFLPHFLCVSYSSDQGKTWSEPKRMEYPDPLAAPGIEEAKAGDFGINSVLPDGEGGYLVFATLRHNAHRHIALLLSRTKDFVTFTPWQRTFGPDAYYVINNDRIVRLSTGRILVAACLHVFNTDGYTHDAGRTVYFYSDDNGDTWTQCPTIYTLPGTTGTADGLQEPGVCELADGTVWSFARTSVGCQYQQFSKDGGETWSTPEPSVFTSPLSPLSMKRVSDGRLVAIWNPVPNIDYTVNRWRQRTPLVIAASSDEGKTWNQFRVLDDAREGNYCYPTLYVDGDGYLLTSYVYTEEGNLVPLAQSKIKRVELSEL